MQYFYSRKVCVRGDYSKSVSASLSKLYDIDMKN